MNEPTFLAVLDFEATCDEPPFSDPTWNASEQEIIELPLALVAIKERHVLATFHTLVRPVLHPRLSRFCTELTSIEQGHLVGMPTIGEAIAMLETWLAEHGVMSGNTLAVTCGDWDLKTMWPKQVGNAPGLKTPSIFRTWTNLKRVFNETTGVKRTETTGVEATGMMGMLRHLGIPHRGHHHCGADDVANLCEIAITLLAAGATFRPTFGTEERRRERARLEVHLARVAATLHQREQAVLRLPCTVDEEIRAKLLAQVDALCAEHAVAAARAAVFEEPAP